MSNARLIAADAGADVVETAGLSFIGHLGIGNHGSRHAAHVGEAVAENLLGDLRLIDAPGDEDRQSDGSAKGARLWRHVTRRDFHRRHHVDRPTETRHRAGRHVYIVERAAAFQLLARSDGVGRFETARLQLLDRGAHAHDKIVADLATYGRQAVGEEPKSVLGAAAVGIGTQVDGRAQELGKQQAVASDQLDAIEPGFGEAPGGLAAGVHQFLDQRHWHRARHGMEAVVGHWGWRISDAAQATAHTLRQPTRVR